MPSSRSKLTPRKTTDELSVLVNADRIRSSIKRLFHNNIAEVVAEILQNSQRASAKNVEITITPNGFSITDDGKDLSAASTVFTHYSNSPNRHSIIRPSKIRTQWA